MKCGKEVLTTMADPTSAAEAPKGEDLTIDGDKSLVDDDTMKGVEKTETQKSHKHPVALTMWSSIDDDARDRRHQNCKCHVGNRVRVFLVNLSNQIRDQSEIVLSNGKLFSTEDIPGTKATTDEIVAHHGSNL